MIGWDPSIALGNPALPLEDGSRIAVVGGGPAGSFFAIRMLRVAKALGRNLEVLVYERRAGLGAYGDPAESPGPSCCNYCAGGISPRMSDVLDELGIEVPPEIVMNRVRSITVQSHWKNLEMKVPEGRRMYSVYRGSRPRGRDDRYQNFDAMLLDHARREGAKIVTAEVTGLSRGADRRPVVDYEIQTDERRGLRSVPVDFLVFAGGVNLHPGMDVASWNLVSDLGRLMPGFRPPETRRTMIFELELTEDLSAAMEGRLFFVLYGSRRLRIDMGSIMPKGKFLTVVLVGPDLDGDRAGRSSRDIVEAFLDLPHIRRVIPRRLSRLTASCVCGPNMVVGAARQPFGDRVAVIGDMVTSRLYKDGIYTGYLTATGLVHALLTGGVDERGLKATYARTVRRLEKDHRYGRLVFLLNSVAFRQPGLSRITYQAVLRERRRASAENRRLESVLWSIASGDRSYRSIFRSMFHPLTILLVLSKGAFITIRNLVTEIVFGLGWKGFGRYPTGIYKEDFEARTAEIEERLQVPLSHFRDFLRMYSIRVRAEPATVMAEVGRIGDPDRRFLLPRFVDIRRTAGGANEVGSVLEYKVALDAFSLKLRLERKEGNTILYRVEKGFPEGGVLVLDVEQNHAGECILSALLGFDFRGGRSWLKGGLLAAMKWLFPTFVHDVVWNHALCRMKDGIERRQVTADAAADDSAIRT